MLVLERQDAKLYLIGVIVQDKSIDINTALKKMEGTHERAIVNHELFDMGFSLEGVDSMYEEVKRKANDSYYSTDDLAEVLSIKFNSLPAGIQERFPETTVKDNLNIKELGKRLKNDILYFGNKSDNEDKALKFLQETKDTEFTVCSQLYFRKDQCGEFNGTPDAILKKKGRVVAVAEFKDYEGPSLNLTQLSTEEKKILSNLKGQGRKQLLFYMKICQVNSGFLVLTCKECTPEVDELQMDDTIFTKLTEKKMVNYNIFKRILKEDSKFLEEVYNQVIMKERERGKTIMPVSEYDQERERMNRNVQ